MGRKTNLTASVLAMLMGIGIFALGEILLNEEAGAVIIILIGLAWAVVGFLATLMSSFAFMD